MFPLKSMLKKIDRKLLPKHRQQPGALPYVTLVYLIFYFFPFFFVTPDPQLVVVIFLALLIFLAIYFNIHWRVASKRWQNIAAMWLLGMALLPHYSGGISFIIYASAMSCLLDSVRNATIAIAAIAITTWLAGKFLLIPEQELYTTLFFVLMIGPLNIYFVDLGVKKRALNLSEQEIKTLAASAERERIARDLHDTIGHTFSVITLKAELAGKLIDRDPVAAKTQINELEQLSRETLSQVRDAVTGYRRSNLRAELVKAKITLESAGFSFDSHYQVSHIEQSVDDELALILREAVTNVIRHSGADHCEINIQTDDDKLTMEVIDNGKNSTITPGNGLKGMRERLQKLHGDFTTETGKQTKLCIELGLKH